MSDQKTPSKQIAVLALGFRPFFLLAGFSAIGFLGYWVWYYLAPSEQPMPANYFNIVQWHAHEMLFAFALSVFAGFLLTSVRNWTGLQTASNGSLFLLIILWIAGRLSLLLGNILPHTIIAIVDILFGFVLAIHLGVIILKSKNTRNYQFLVWLIALVTGNVLMHAGVLYDPQYFQHGWYLTLYTMLAILSVVLGRILPFFTERGLQMETPFIRRTWLNHMCLLLLISTGLAQIFKLPDLYLSIIAISASLVHLVRLISYYNHKIWHVPLLWILHIGYFWLVLALLLLGITPFYLNSQNYALHAMTTGALGILTLGMMARVTLGHSGRPLRANKIITLSFVLIALVPILRVIGPIFDPTHYKIWIMSSATFWLLAFGLFIITFTPILVKPRVDGKPG